MLITSCGKSLVSVSIVDCFCCWQRLAINTLSTNRNHLHVFTKRGGGSNQVFKLCLTPQSTVLHLCHNLTFRFKMRYWLSWDTTMVKPERRVISALRRSSPSWITWPDGNNRELRNWWASQRHKAKLHVRNHYDRNDFRHETKNLWYVCVYVCIYVCMYLLGYVCVWLCMRVSMYVCVHVGMFE